MMSRQKFYSGMATLMGVGGGVVLANIRPNMYSLSVGIGILAVWLLVVIVTTAYEVGRDSNAPR